MVRVQVLVHKKRHRTIHHIHRYVVALDMVEMDHLQIMVSEALVVEAGSVDAEHIQTTVEMMITVDQVDLVMC